MHNGDDFGRGFGIIGRMGEMEFKIVSGGQTGIDQAALAAAVAAEVPYGGWVPKGRRTEAGSLDAKYTAMQEMPTDDYRKRTRQNVVDSDATLILTRGEPSGGTAETIEFCKQHQKPYRVYDLAQNVADLLPPHWVVELLIELVNEVGKDAPVVNVAGPRESKCPGKRTKGVDCQAAMRQGSHLGHVVGCDCRGVDFDIIYTV